MSVGFHEAARGVLSHHMVIEDGKIANYQPYPPTPWNASPRDVYGTPGPYEDAVQNTPIFEENGPENFKGDRHHEGGPLVRPVPAVRRAHVRRQGAGAEGGPHSDGALLSHGSRAADSPCAGAHGSAGGPRRPGVPRARRGAHRRRRADVRRRARADRRADRRRGDARPARRGRAGRRAPDDPRPVSRADRGAGDGRRSTPCGPTWSRTAATSSCSGSRTAWRSCACEGSCKSCRASSSTLELAVRQALEEAAPDLLGHGRGGRGRGGERRRSRASRCPFGERSTRVAHPRYRSRPSSSPRPQVDGMSLVVANVDGTLLAYRNRCASCGGDTGGRGARWRRARAVRAAAARTSCRRPAARWTTTTSSSSRSRCCARPEEIRVAL